MFRHIRELLTLGLVALLPLHAFLVTLGTQWITGPGHAPLSSLAVWKEALLLIILVICFVEILRRKSWKTFIHLDVYDWLILAFLLLSVALGIWQGQFLSRGFIYGFRYDAVPLIAFFILRRIDWSEDFALSVKRVLIVVGGAVAGYGILTFFLPQQFFMWLGYSDLHSLYLPDQPIAAFQQIGGTTLRRIQSTMSGPNQLGLWLLIPWSVLLVDESMKQWKKIPLILLLAAAILLSFSRSAWIAVAVITLVGMWKELPWSVFRKRITILGASGVIGVGLLLIFAPNILIRAASTSDHFKRPVLAIQRIVAQPLGHGLGTAGPASNRISDACVFLEAGADTTWAQDRTDLCVFAGNVQMQPTDHLCSCPFLPENWYLQLGVELGVIGMFIFLALVVLILKTLLSKRDVDWSCLAFLGIGIAALFLHAWEDAALSYTLWMGVAVRLKKESNRFL